MDERVGISGGPVGPPPWTAVLLSEALALAGVGSVTPAGGVIVAVLLSVPVVAVTVQVAEKVTLEPDVRLTSSLMFPVPDGLVHPAPVQVHVQPVRPAGKLSVTVAPVTSQGPALDATMV